MIKLENLNIKIFSEFNKNLESLWINFEKESEHYFFQTFKWQKLWFYHMKKFKKKISNYTIVVEHDDEILLILPLCIKEIFVFKVLSWSGFPFSDYNAPLIKKGLKFNSAIFNTIWNKILLKNKSSYNCIFFDNQPEFIKKTHNPLFIFLEMKRNNAYFGLNINENISINKKELINIKYQKNRLKKLGNLNFKIANNLEERKKVISFIIQKKRHQFSKTNAFNIFKIDCYKIFFIKNCLGSNASLTYLTLNNIIIAANMGYIFKKDFYYIFPTYDDYFKRYSPGKILLYELIKYIKSKSFIYFDFTIGTEKYKKNWSDVSTTSNYMIKSINFIGSFYVFLLKFKFFVKKIGIINNYMTKIFNRIKLSVLKS